MPVILLVLTHFLVLLHLHLLLVYLVVAFHLHSVLPVRCGRHCPFWSRGVHQVTRAQRSVECCFTSSTRCWLRLTNLIDPCPSALHVRRNWQFCLLVHARRGVQIVIIASLPAVLCHCLLAHAQRSVQLTIPAVLLVLLCHLGFGVRRGYARRLITAGAWRAFMVLMETWVWRRVHVRVTLVPRQVCRLTELYLLPNAPPSSHFFDSRDHACLPNLPLLNHLPVLVPGKQILEKKRKK